MLNKATPVTRIRLFTFFIKESDLLMMTAHTFVDGNGEESMFSLGLNVSNMRVQPG